MSLEVVEKLRSAKLVDFEYRLHRSHPLHTDDRIWNETNCYVDLWIELLHALGLDPVASCAFTISTGFEGDQWTFFKLPPEDLRELFGIDVFELNVWRPVVNHLLEQMYYGRMLSIEVDSYFLPDTSGVSYRAEHTKTTLCPVSVDLDRRWMAYLHGRGCHELEGDDFDGVFRLGQYPPSELPPYVEVIRISPLHRESADDLRQSSLRLLRRHLSRRPRMNPVRELAQRVAFDVPWLIAGDSRFFHAYAFAVCRQCGASAEVAASFLEWLDDTSGAVEDFRALALAAKSLQFALARTARGRTVDVSGILEGMVWAYDRAIAALVAEYDG